MPDMTCVLACLSSCLESTTLRQLSRVTEAMRSMTGRVTMRSMARGAGAGGRYRTIQRFFITSIRGATLQWVLIRHHRWDPDEVILMGGDDVVVTKAGQHTHGWDRLFFLPMWENGPWAGFSACIPHQCHTPHLLPGYAGTT